MAGPRPSPAALATLATVAILSVIAAHGFYIDPQQSPEGHEWSYGHQDEWRRQQRVCAGSAQSPIDIQRKHVIQNSQLKLHFYNYNQPTRFTIQNAHHTIKLNPVAPAGAHPASKPARQATSAAAAAATGHQAADATDNGALESLAGETDGELDESSPSADTAGPLAVNVEPLAGSGAAETPPAGYGGAPTIKLDWLDDGNNEYKLRDIHFHWAERRDNGSEHAIDGRRAAMEMHLVHIKHGLENSKIGFTSDSVAVIAVLIESYRKSNADFNPIVNALAHINMTDEAHEIEYKTLNDLLPNILTSFYTYSGSLTTPPCYQVVNWIVMSDRLYLNAKQIEMFRNMYAPPATAHEAAPGDRLRAAPSPSSDSEQASAAATSALSAIGAGSSEPSSIMPNIRQLQPLNNRTIMASFAALSRLEQIQVAGGSQQQQQQPPTGYGSSGAPASGLVGGAPSLGACALLAAALSLATVLPPRGGPARLRP